MNTVKIRTSAGEKDIPLTGPIRLGRGAQCEVVLDDTEVSRVHLSIEPDAGGVLVTDLGSTNGTTLGGAPLPKNVSTEWLPGQIVQLGAVTLELVGDALLEDTGATVTGGATGAPAPPDPVRMNLFEGIAHEPEWDRKGIELEVADVIRETHDVTTFRFLPGPLERFHYKPGQFIGIEAEIDGELVKRTYSISSSPSRPLLLDITVKRVPGGAMSNWLPENVAPGQRMRIRPPGGKFSVLENPCEKALFLAAGSGITPLMSMLRWVADVQAPIDITFLNSVRSTEDIIFAQELESIARANRNIRVTVAITEPSDFAGGWLGIDGRLDKGKLTALVPDIEERDAFLCGPKPFSDAIIAALGELGLTKDRIHSESFGGRPRPKAPSKAAEAPAPAAPPPPPVAQTPPPAPPAEPSVSPPAPAPAAGSAPVPPASGAAVHRISFRASQASAAVQPGMSILELGEECGLELPFSCREGMCGTCRTRKISGEVEMEEHDLSPEELAEGWIYLCTSRAKGDVEVDA